MQKQLELHQRSPTRAKKIFNLNSKLTLSAQSELPPLSTLTFFFLIIFGHCRGACGQRYNVNILED